MCQRIFLVIFLNFNFWGCSSETKKSGEVDLKESIKESLIDSEKKKTSALEASKKEPIEFTLNGYAYYFLIEESEDSTVIFLNQGSLKSTGKRIAEIKLEDPYTHYYKTDVNNDGRDDLLFRTLYARGNHYYVLFLSEKNTNHLVYVPQYEELSEPEYNKERKWIQSSFYTRDGALYKETWKWEGIKLRPFHKVELERIWDKEAKKVTGCKLHTYLGKHTIFQRQKTKNYTSEEEALNVFEKSLWDDSQ